MVFEHFRLKTPDYKLNMPVRQYPLENSELWFIRGSAGWAKKNATGQVAFFLKSLAG